jgi:hypothetical protein
VLVAFASGETGGAVPPPLAHRTLPRRNDGGDDRRGTEKPASTKIAH